MLHTGSVWLLALAFFGAGLFNTIGTAATQRDFVRWGYPAWWCRLTGGLETAVAVLVLLPAPRAAGLVLGAVIVAAAAVTVVRRRELFHLIPLGLFAVLLILPELTS